MPGCHKHWQEHLWLGCTLIEFCLAEKKRKKRKKKSRHILSHERHGLSGSLECVSRQRGSRKWHKFSSCFPAGACGCARDVLLAASRPPDRSPAGDLQDPRIAPWIPGRRWLIHEAALASIVELDGLAAGEMSVAQSREVDGALYECAKLAGCKVGHVIGVLLDRSDV